MFLPEVEVSAKEKVLKRTEVFTSEKESASYKFPEKIKEDGKTYLLKKRARSYGKDSEEDKKRSDFGCRK